MLLIEGEGKLNDAKRALTVFSSWVFIQTIFSQFPLLNREIAWYPSPLFQLPRFFPILWFKEWMESFSWVSQATQQVLSISFNGHPTNQSREAFCFSRLFVGYGIFFLLFDGNNSLRFKLRLWCFASWHQLSNDQEKEFPIMHSIDPISLLFFWHFNFFSVFKLQFILADSKNSINWEQKLFKFEFLCWLWILEKLFIG